jgi:hypothetical protein
MVGAIGLEPTTSRSQTARASQLRHAPIAFMTEVIIHLNLAFAKLIILLFFRLIEWYNRHQ